MDDYGDLDITSPWVNGVEQPESKFITIKKRVILQEQQSPMRIVEDEEEDGPNE